MCSLIPELDVYDGIRVAVELKKNASLKYVKL